MPRSFVIGILVLGNIFVWTIPVPHGLTVSFLDVGQGRATLLQGPTGASVLIDGGPDSSVLRGVGSELPFFVRSLDAVIETNTDAGNIGGLSSVLERYHVRAFIEPGMSATTKAVQALREEVAASQTKDILAKRGMRLILGRGAYADIPSPGVIRIVYGDTSFLFPSDARQKIMKSDVLLVPHYGSKDSLSQSFLNVVAPHYAVLSYGCDNRWNYPAPQTTELLTGIETVSTCEDGTTTFVSDGHSVTRL